MFKNSKSMKREKLSLVVLAVEIATIALLHTTKVSNTAHAQAPVNKSSAPASQVNSVFTLVSYK